MGSSSTENSCSSSMCSGRLSVTWISVISLLAVAVTVNMMFTGFLLWIMRNGQAGLETKMEKLQSDVLDMQVHHVSTDMLNKHVTNILSENGRERLKRSALSSTQSSQLAVNVGSLFVSAVKQMCKPEGVVCIPGPKGETGEDGRDGLPGLTGQAGRDGQRGLPGLGIDGRPGSKGSPGKQGPRGMGGMKGETGEKGEMGHKGDRGERGERGVDGQQGDVGAQGEKGDTGDKGERGWTGYKGEKGGKGEIGLQGEKGMKGEKGIQGDEGDLSGWVGLPDPCLPWNHRLLNDSWRKTSEYAEKAGYHCDKEGYSSSHGFKPGWHSFSSSIGGAMPETCPQRYYCGTSAGGWLKGSHPNVVGQTLSRTVCFNWGSYCCDYQTTVEVINCGKYYVYDLPYTPGCHHAYCAQGN